MAVSKTGPAPFGLRREAGRLLREPHEAIVLLEIFRLFAQHKRKRLVAEILNAEGRRTRSGGLFSGQTLGRYLTDPRYKGIATEVDALVPEKLWDHCQEILSGQAAAGGAARTIVHLFSGYLFCGCGQKMYVPSNSEKYVCGSCREKIPSDDLEAVFAATLDLHGSSESDIWPDLEFSQRREVIEQVTDRIEVQNRDIRLFLLDI